MANPESKRLAIDVVARVDRLEREMNKAKRSTNNNFGQMERRGQQFQSRMAGIGRAAFAGFTAGAVAAMAPMALFRRSLTELQSAARLNDVSKMIGVGVEDLQRLRYGFEQTGVAADATDTAMRRFARRIGEAANGGGQLYEVLKANGVALRDSNGNMRSQMDLLRDYANLIRNAGSHQERLSLAFKAFDTAGSEMVQALSNGADGLDTLMDKADEAGGIISKELVDRAAELDTRFNDVWRNFEIQSKVGILAAVTALDDFINRIRVAQSALGNLGNADVFRRMAGWLDDMGLMSLELNRGMIDEAQDRAEMSALQNRVSYLTEHVKSLRAIGEDTAAAESQLAEAKARLDQRVREITSGGSATELPAITVSDSGPTTIIPGGSGGGSKGSRDAAARAALREAEAVLNVIEALQAERQQIGMSDVERAKANALRVAGAAATTEQAREIMELIEAIYAEREALEETNRAMAEMRDLGRNVMGNFISDMVEGRKATDALADALRNVGNRLLNSGLDALFDGLFKGFSDGGFVGRGFAEGGYTGAGGKHQAKGVVHGGEYVFSKEATQRAGVGNLEAMHRSLKGYASGGLVGAMPSLPSMPKVAGAAQSGPPVVVNFNPQIDARGADQAGLARVEAQLQRMKGEMPAVAIDAVRKAQAGRML